MKIIVINTVPSDKNGITNVAFNLLNAIEDRDLEFEYVSITEIDSKFLEILKKKNIPYHIVPQKFKDPIGYSKAIYGIVKDADAIHVHGNSATMGIEMAIGKIRGVKKRIAHCHNSNCKMKYADKILRPVFYLFNNKRVACGTEARKWLFGSRECLIINNGVETDKFRYNPLDNKDIRNRLDWRDNSIIGHIGNFLEVKNHRFIIDVFSEIIKSNGDMRLLLLGGGNLLEETKQYARALGCDDKIHFAGSVDAPQKYLSAMDVILMPSLYEGFPLTLVEEQANGLSCVCSDTISDKTNLTGNVKYISLNAPLQEWADTVISNITDREEREEKSKKNIQKIKEVGFDIHSAAAALVDFYREEK